MVFSYSHMLVSSYMLMVEISAKAQGLKKNNCLTTKPHRSNYAVLIIFYWHLNKSMCHLGHPLLTDFKVMWDAGSERVAKSFPGEPGNLMRLTTCVLRGNAGWNSSQALMEASAWAWAWAWAGGKVQWCFCEHCWYCYPVFLSPCPLASGVGSCQRKEEGRRKGRALLVLNILPFHSPDSGQLSPLPSQHASGKLRNRGFKVSSGARLWVSLRT